jgi:2-dehydro-3-deoxy-D-arabinonate dehydratase
LTPVVRVRHAGSERAGWLQPGDTVAVLDHDEPLAALQGDGAVVAEAPLGELELLPPIEAPEIWCAGVTYERSRDARLEEAATEARDVYALVYEAERPELFLKDAAMRRTVGPGGTIRTRRDAGWNVPEPELGVVIGAGGEPVAVTVGNDVSSRDIEGANPLYIPQAKIFAGACAIGPALVVPDDWERPWPIRLRVADASGRELFAGETSTAKMRRTPRELVSWVVRDNPVPAGTVLLTGTGLVPADDYTLRPGHRVEVTIDGIGTLVNTVGGDG